MAVENEYPHFYYDFYSFLRKKFQIILAVSILCVILQRK